MTRPGRDRMVPPGSGRPLRPDQDCPNCAATMTREGDRKVCSAGCGHSQAVPR